MFTFAQKHPPHDPCPASVAAALRNLKRAGAPGYIVYPGFLYSVPLF
jgi:hypothetical protein